MADKKPKKKVVHKDLGKLDIHINEFGNIETNMNIDKLNSFLDKNVKDKKLDDKPAKEKKR